SAPLHLLPTLWFRNTWSWDGGGGAQPVMKAGGPGTIVASHADLGAHTLTVIPGSAGTPELLFTDNVTNAARLWGSKNESAFVKDAFHERVVGGSKDAVNPGKTGTKAAA